MAVDDQEYHFYDVDSEIVDYTKENNLLTLMQVGEEVALFKKKSSGSAIAKTEISSWDDPYEYSEYKPSY